MHRVGAGAQTRLDGQRGTRLLVLGRARTQGPLALLEPTTIGQFKRKASRLGGKASGAPRLFEQDGGALLCETSSFNLVGRISSSSQIEAYGLKT